VIRGITTAFIRGLQERAHDAERERTRMLNEAHARWRPLAPRDRIGASEGGLTGC
jgi:hypothetical protein